MASLATKSVGIKQRYELYLAKALNFAIFDAAKSANPLDCACENLIQQNEDYAEYAMTCKVQRVALLTRSSQYIL